MAFAFALLTVGAHVLQTHNAEMADEITITILNIYLSKQLHDVYRSLCVKSN